MTDETTHIARQAAAPERIWLQEPAGLEDERTWCAEPQTDDDTPYVRADLTRPSLAGDERVAQALKRAERKLSAYVGVCKGDKELTETVLPMVRAALSAMNTPAQGGEE